MGTGNFNIFYWLLAVVAIGITISNFMKMRTYNREKKFVETYSKALKKEKDAYEAVQQYVEEEKEQNLKNKARVIQIYEMLSRGEDVDNIIESIDFEPIFKTKGRFDAKLANRNGDLYVWLALVYARTNALKKKEVIEKLAKKLEPYNELLNNNLEYQLSKGYTSALIDKKNENYGFLNKLLEGDYAGMVYEKRLIGLYKRLAASFLAKNSDEIDEYYANDLKQFAGTLVGKTLLNELGIYDKYQPEEVPVEEESLDKPEEEPKEIEAPKKAVAKKVTKAKEPKKETAKKTTKKVTKKKETTK